MIIKLNKVYNNKMKNKVKIYQKVLKLLIFKMIKLLQMVLMVYSHNITDNLYKL